MVSPTRKFLYTPFKIIISIAFLSVSRPVFCGELLKEQSIEYRQKGYEAQKAGMLGEALTYYQKAMQLDPSSALIYNDLGVIRFNGEYVVKDLIKNRESFEDMQAVFSTLSNKEL